MNFPGTLGGSRVTWAGQSAASRLARGERSIGYPAVPGSVAQRSPFPEFGIIQLVDNGGKANYNSLAVQADEAIQLPA